MKRITWYVLLALLILTCITIPLASPASAANINVSANTNWSALSPAPGAGDVITISNGATLTFDVASATVNTINLGDLVGTSAGTLNMTAGGTLSINGSLNVYSGNLNAGTGTIEFGAAGDQFIPALTYNNLSTSGSGTKTLDFLVSVAGNLTIGANTTLLADIWLQVKGNWTNNGTFNGTTNQSFVQLTNSTAQTLSGATTFYDVDIDNTVGITISNNITASHSISLTNGIITTGNNLVIVPIGSTVTRTAGYINGNLQKGVATGPASVAFEVGTSAGYNPVTVSFGNVTASGNLTAKAVAGQHPNIATSSINPVKDVNVYWNIVNSGVVFNNYNATFVFNPTDITGGAAFTNFIAGKRDGIAWTYPAITARTVSGITTAGMTAFSDFAMGESLPASKLVFTTTAQTIGAGAVSGIITVQTQDAVNNPTNLTAPATIALTTNSTAGRFDTASGGPFNGSITSVTIPAGSNSASFYYKDTKAGAALITTSSTGLTSATQTETITAGTANKLVILPPAQTLTAGIVSGPITVQVQDALNNPANVSANTTVSLGSNSAAGRFDTASGGPFNGSITSVTIANGSNSAVFFYKDTAAGGPTITATAAGLTNGTQIETINAAAASKVVFTTAAQTIFTGNASTVMTIQTQDAFNNPANMAANTTVTLASTSGTGRFDTAAAGPFDGAITSVTIPAAGNTVSFYYKDSASGAPTITASSGTLTSATQTETVNVPGTPAKLVITTAAQTLTAGAASANFTVELRDVADAPTPAGVGGVVVTLASSSPTTGVFGASAAIPPAVTSVTIPQGATTVSFFYKDTRSGTPTVTASGTSLLAATQSVTINPAAIDHYAVSNIGAQISGAAFSVTINAQDAFNNNLTTGGETVNIAVGLPDAGLSPASVVTTNGSVIINNLTLTVAQVGQTLTFTGATSTKIGTSNTFNVTAAIPNRIAFITSPQTLNAGTASAAMTILTQDAVGNPANVAADTVVNLTSTSVNGKFDTAANGAFNGSVTSVTIPGGANSFTFYYKDATLGNPTLTAASTGLTSANQQQTVNAGPASKIVFTTAAQNLVAGAASGMITIQTRDAVNNPSNVTAAATVVLTSNSTGGAFSINNTFAATITSVTIPSGQNSVSFYYKDTRSGTSTITAAATGLTSGTQQQTINPDVLHHYSISQIGSVTANVPVNVTMTAQDVNNNNLGVGSEALAITLGKTDAGATPLTAITANGTVTVPLKFTVAQTGQSITVTGAVSSKTGTSNTFAVVAQIAPVVVGGGGGGGGGGSGDVIVYTTQLKGTLPNLNSAGNTVTAYELKTNDDKVTLNIPANTKLTDGNNNKLTVLSAAVVAAPPDPPASNSIVMAYDFGPNGSVFSPAINITMSYAGLTLPPGVSESSLNIAWWNGTNWQILTGTVNTTNKTVTVAVTHFTLFALMGPQTATPTPTPTASATPTPSVTQTTAPATSTPSSTPSVAPTTTPTPAATIEVSPSATTSQGVTPSPESQTTGPDPATPDQSSSPAAPASNWVLIVAIIGAILVIGVVTMVIRSRRK